MSEKLSSNLPNSDIDSTYDHDTIKQWLSLSREPIYLHLELASAIEDAELKPKYRF